MGCKTGGFQNICSRWNIILLKQEKLEPKLVFSKVIRCNITTQREGFKLIKEDARLKREVTTKGANSGGK